MTENNPLKISANSLNLIISSLEEAKQEILEY